MGSIQDGSLLAIIVLLLAGDSPKEGPFPNEAQAKGERNTLGGMPSLLAGVDSLSLPLGLFGPPSL